MQIGALSGVTDSASGLASGLVETMREIGGAAGVAAVSTVLISQAGLDGFQTAFVLIAIIGALGALTAAVAFERRAGVTEATSQEPEVPYDEEVLVPAAGGLSEQSGP